MANNCYFDMKIAGKESGIRELLDMLNWNGPEDRPGFGRVYSLEVYNTETIAKKEGEDLLSVWCNGDCAWSVYTAMLDDGTRNPNLETETERLGLALEVYSSEPGIGFQEHYIIDKGKIIEEEERDYQEHWIEMMKKEDIIEVCKENEIPYEDIDEYINDNGDLCIGGFGEEFGVFQDLSGYVLSPALIEAEQSGAYKLVNIIGTEYTVYPHLGSYIQNDNLYVGLEYDDSDLGCRSFYGDVTVNIGKLPYLEAAIDVNNNGEGILAFLLQNGFGKVSGKVLQSGFCTYPVFCFNEAKLKEIDAEGFLEYAALHGKRGPKEKTGLNDKIQDAKMRQSKTEEKREKDAEKER